MAHPTQAHWQGASIASRNHARADRNAVSLGGSSGCAAAPAVNGIRCARHAANAHSRRRRRIVRTSVAGDGDEVTPIGVACADRVRHLPRSSPRNRRVKRHRPDMEARDVSG